MKTLKKNALWIVLIVLVVGAGWYWWKDSKKKAADAAKAEADAKAKAAAATAASQTSAAECGFTHANWEKHSKTELKIGSTGCAVSLLQKAINKTYPTLYKQQSSSVLQPIALAPLVEDGVFGEKTLESVLAVAATNPTIATSISLTKTVTLESLDTASLGKIQKLFV